MGIEYLMIAAVIKGTLGSVPHALHAAP